MDLFLSESRKPQDHVLALLVLLLHLQGSSSQAQSLKNCAVIAVRRDKVTLNDDISDKMQTSLNLVMIQKSILNNFGSEIGKSESTDIILPLHLSVDFFGSDPLQWPENVTQRETDGASSILLRALIVDDVDLNKVLPSITQDGRETCVIPYDFFPLIVKSDPFMSLNMSSSTTNTPPSLVTTTPSPSLATTTPFPSLATTAPSLLTTSSLQSQLLSVPVSTMTPTFGSKTISSVPTQSSSSTIAHSLPPVAHFSTSAATASAGNNPPSYDNVAVKHPQSRELEISQPRELFRSSSSSSSSSSRRQQGSSSHSRPIMLTIAEAEIIASRAAASSALSVHTEHVRVSLLSAAQYLSDESGVKLNPAELANIVKEITDKALDDLKGALDRVESPNLISSERSLPQVPIQTAAIRRRISPELILR